MRHLRRLAVLCTLLLGGLGAAQAGPWPREPGTAFLSTSLGGERANGDRRAFAEVYGEGGWRPGLVPAVRLRLDSPLGQDGRGDGAADLRLRWHPGRTGALALGFEGGVSVDSGARLDDGTLGSAGFGLAAVHLGRGLQTPFGPGWMRLTLSTEEPLTDRGTARREVLTQLGLRSEGGWLGIVSLSAFRRAGDTTVKLKPGLGRSLGDGRDLLLEGVVERGGVSTRGLSLSLWQSF